MSFNKMLWPFTTSTRTTRCRPFLASICFLWRRTRHTFSCLFLNYPLDTALLSSSRWIGNPINHSSTTVNVSPSCLSAHVFNHTRFSKSN